MHLAPVEDELVELQAFGNLVELYHRPHVMMQVAAATATTPLLRVTNRSRVNGGALRLWYTLMSVCVPTACKRRGSQMGRGGERGCEGVRS